MGEALDPETLAWIEAGKKKAELERAALFKEMKAQAQAPGVSRPGPDEAALENWLEMYGPENPPPL